jgi:uncharacterized protein
MKKFLVALLVLNVVALAPLRAQDPQSSHYKAAEQMLNMMDMETVLRRAIDEMLKQQISVNPTLVPFEDVMRKFLMKYMSWDSLKADTIQLYMTEFTEAELNEMNKFYATPTGKKMVERMPALMSKGAEMGARRVQSNMGELENAMREEAQKMQAASGASSPGAASSPAAAAKSSPSPAAKKDEKPKGKP